ncbi:HTTM domain-containing protein [Luethyella okanaganae]|uniref:HTTM domain-containing protein n=1 Tax=Luethyella okanaganae TaxID=69372 RepID=A0ABW1VDM0_9MICO
MSVQEGGVREVADGVTGGRAEVADRDASAHEEPSRGNGVIGDAGFVSVWRHSVSGITALLRRGEGWLLDAKHALYGLAVTRILLGITILGTTLGEFTTRDYTYGVGGAWTGQIAEPQSDFIAMWPFSVTRELANTPAGLLAVFAILLLLGVLFTVGYRTRLVMIPLFVVWVGFLGLCTYVQNQSDNLTRIAFIALAFCGLSDHWSLDARRGKRFARRDGNVLLRLWRGLPVLPSWLSVLAHNLGIVVLGAQICFVYSAGGLFKAGGEPWQDGTAVYAPLQTAQFGTWPILSDIATAWGPAVGMATIGTVVIQSAFPLLLLRRGTRILALMVIMGFHVAIGVMMGLPWFSLAMIALDAIFVRDRSWRGFARRAETLWRRVVSDARREPLVPEDDRG